MERMNVHLDGMLQTVGQFWEFIITVPIPILLLSLAIVLLLLFALIYVLLYILAPIPRAPYASEKTYTTSTPTGETTAPLQCWYDTWLLDQRANISRSSNEIESPEVFMSVVIPAYNEEARLEKMLLEAVDYLDAEYGRSTKPSGSSPPSQTALETASSPSALKARPNATSKRNGHVKASASWPIPTGYEILLVSDGSTDATTSLALSFSKKHSLHNILRVVTLSENRGKGGAVVHGFRHVRGAYALFVDADGASRFSDLGKLVSGCKGVEDSAGRGVAVGSRAHMVGSEAVVKRSAFRNALMHSFHLLLRLLTPPATSRIRDTQCGFKLFSRASLPHIVPFMHAEGWIFDVEMLMLAESASPALSSASSENEKTMKPGTRGIGVAEVPIGWHEIEGSKMNVLWDSFGMAWGLGMLRACWMLRIYRR